ncbi:MAG: thermonuclease family protein [candidate division Zixibacteria bacterium]|nr:thermonuclease family protein [candidate division Zixibacteria bacterium]
MVNHNRQRRLVIRLAIMILLVVVLVAFRFVGDIGQEKHPNERFIVVSVKDGDTFTMTGGDKVRLLSMDTPEKGEPFYDEATRLLSDLVLGEEVHLEFATKRRDKYGRLLGYVYVDSLFVNRAILENGLANLYLFKDTDLDREETNILLGAQRLALERKVGLWSLEREKEDYYVARPGSFRFHRPGCGNLRRSNSQADRLFDHRREALWEGLSPCRRCRP